MNILHKRGRKKSEQIDFLFLNMTYEYFYNFTYYNLYRNHVCKIKRKA